MEAGRNFENPSRLGLLFLSNSFIAHPFSRCRVCALCARPLASCSKYRRLEKRKSRLAAYLPPVESLNSLHFPPSLAAPRPFRAFPPPLAGFGSKFRTARPPPFALRNGWQMPEVPRIRRLMRVPVVRLTVILLTLVLAWPSSALSQAPSSPVPSTARREVRVGAPGIPAALDPATALEGTLPLIAHQVFDTLVAYREGTTDVEPALATRWSVSRDGLTWSFTLRDGVRFHDGTPLTSADVVASFMRQLRPDASGTSVVWSALFRGTPGVVRDVRAPDPRTVQIVLLQPYAPLVTVLAHPGLGVVKSVTGGDGTARLIGTGPYRVVDASAERLALEAVPGYWAAPPKSERLVFLEVGGDDQAEAELDARTIDIWFPPGPPRRTEGALSLPGLRVGYLAFQTEKVPFSRKKLRQAVAAALDPVVIGVALEGAAVPLPSFLPPGVWAPVTAGDPHLLLFPLSTTEVASKGPRTLNFSFYRNPTLDGMLIRASQLTFRTERQRLYHRAQFLLAQELPWLPIYVRLNWAVARGDVHGLRLHPTGFSRLDTVTLEAAPGAER